MTQVEIVNLLQTYLWAGVWIASPMLITALVVGVVIGLFQALTSIQELTLTFVPKLIAMLIAFLFSLSFAVERLLKVFDDSILKYVSV